MLRVSNPILPWSGWGSLSDWGHSRWELYQTVHSYHTQIKRTNSAFLWGFMSVKVFLMHLSSQTDLRTSFKMAWTNAESQNPVIYCLILLVNNHLSKGVLQCSSLNTSRVVSAEPDSSFSLSSLQMNSLSTTNITASKSCCKNLFEMVTLNWGLSIASKAWCPNLNSFEIFNLNNKLAKHQHIQVVIS